EKLEYRLPVDAYIGGAEHAVLHLLYSRFWHKVLYDLGVVPTPEPFQKLTNQGLILGEDGQKMSKSMGNVVNPDDVIVEFGADAIRLYEMFMGPLEMSKPWSTKNIAGVRRFLEKVWRLLDKPILPETSESEILIREMQKTIKKVGDDIESYKFNTAISALMIGVNNLGKENQLKKKTLETLLILLAPFAPHLTEECWHRLGNEYSIHQQSWPNFEEIALATERQTYVFMVNGKLRESQQMPKDITKEELLSQAKILLTKYIVGKAILKEVVVPNKLVNLVVSE
ncbi:MAG: class I tRNA ligase family protein, partial [Candidatus Margulisiibacteriota bacterium]